MKISISQPMKGKTDEEILKAKENGINEYKKYLKYEKNIAEPEMKIIDTFFKDFDGNAVQFLGRSIQEGLAKADVAIFLPNWSTARGCRLEHEIAVAYGIPTFYINV